ncbi:hypothetical protein L249_2586 [Ophiocordyceps polyrhachis-furcata BCC 54312]|uniref:Uncharacterized protein n=1 Tax=Ophiocordyceps polyrhachis-furcata BCC 54312 TaxID=1330021 RepID=A0A367LP84_9HYPO|nr:hypothetical protein L249_2586 [Ophiocordyceps polyrhachis-furcata BCC 54312]
MDTNTAEDETGAETRSLTDSVRQHVLDGTGTSATTPTTRARTHSPTTRRSSTVGFSSRPAMSGLTNSRFHGMDLSPPIQPDWVPENVEFFVDDFEDDRGWGYAANSFDYIHVRHTTHSIKNRLLGWRGGLFVMGLVGHGGADGDVSR